MKSAIDLLKQSIKATQNEAVRAQAELDEAMGIVRNKEKVVKELVNRTSELEAGLAMLEYNKKVSKKNV